MMLQAITRYFIVLESYTSSLLNRPSRNAVMYSMQYPASPGDGESRPEGAVELFVRRIQNG